jgi:hypothetical protein
VCGDSRLGRFGKTRCSYQIARPLDAIDHRTGEYKYGRTARPRIDH